MIKKVSKTTSITTTVSKFTGVILASLIKLAFGASGILFMIKIVFDNLTWFKVFLPILILLFLYAVSFVVLVAFYYIHQKFGNNFYVYCESTDEVINNELQPIQFYSKRKLMNKFKATKIAKQFSVDGKRFVIKEEQVTKFEI